MKIAYIIVRSLLGALLVTIQVYTKNSKNRGLSTISGMVLEFSEVNSQLVDKRVVDCLYSGDVKCANSNDYADFYGR